MMRVHRPVAWLVLFCLVAATGMVRAADDARRKTSIPGPYSAGGLTFYIVHPGGPLKVDLVTTVGDKGTGKVVYRFFDRDENLVTWDYLKLPAASTTVRSFDYGKEAPAGIYQVRWVAHNAVVNLKPDPAHRFAVSPSRSMLAYIEKEQYKSTYLWVPPGAGDFKVNSIGLVGTVSGPDGKKLGTFQHGKPLSVPGAKFAGKVLHLDIPAPRVGGYYRFGFSGLDPVILGADAETVRAVGDGFLRKPDGTLYAHRFQARMQAWIDGLTKEDLELKPVPLSDYAEQWVEHPREATALLHHWGSFRHINFLLRDHVVDPKDKDFGSFRLKPTPGTLALVYALDRPYNPYYNNKALRNRLLLTVFQDLMTMKSNDTWEASDSGYSGGDALMGTHRFMPLYLGGRAIEDRDLRNLWVDALSRLVHRFPFHRVSCENQSSHWPIFFRTLFEVTGDTRYDRLARDFIETMSTPEKNPFMKTGYQEEAYGPDATYQGLGACCQAFYYRMSGDETARDGLRRIYTLFNHTVAPEPDGRVLGASGFSHRTKGSWVRRQYGGGLHYMAGELPEAAAWVDDDLPVLDKDEIARRLKDNDDYIRRVPQVLKYATAVFGTYFRYVRFPTDPLPDGKLPVVAEDRFTRNFNDEFLAVRQPGYYAVGYLKGTAPEWSKNRRRDKPDNPSSNNGWGAVQGMQVFWTPDYGNLFLSMNWNGSTHRMVRGDLADGRIAYPDYWDIKSRFDERTDVLTIRQGMVNLPMSVTRQIAFKDDRVEQVLEVRALEDVAARALYDQLPLVVDKPGFTLLARRNGTWSDTLDAPADALWAGNKAGHGVLLELSRAVPVSLGKAVEFSGRRSRPLRLGLPSTMKAGTVDKLVMTLRGVRRDELKGDRPKAD